MPDSAAATVIPVTLEVPLSLVPADTPSRTGSEQLAARTRRELKQLARGLGVPGHVDVTVVPVNGGAIRVRVHGVDCPYPEETISRVWSALNGQVLAPADPQAASPGQGRRFARLADLVAGVCRAIIVRRPSALMTAPQAARYARGTSMSRLPPEWLLGALQRVLDARVSIADRSTVAALLEELEGGLCRKAAEALIARLRPSVVTVLLRREYLRQITTGDDRRDPTVVAGVRRRLQEELGVAMPELRFVEDRSLHPRAVVFRVNDLETIPWIGLARDACLVDDSVETMSALGMSAHPALNPVSELENAIIARDRRDEAASYHLRTWLPHEYLGLCLEATLRAQAACLVDNRTVEQRLEALEWAGSSCAGLGRRLPTGRIVRVMRALLAEGVSVSDFPGILEVLDEQQQRLMENPDTDPVWSEDGDAAADARDADAAAAARRRLARQVAAGVVIDSVKGSVTAIVLDEQLHQLVAATQAASEALAAEDTEHIARSVRAALTAWPGARWPALLTTAEVRGALRDALAPQFPDLSVVAFEELPADVSFRVVATVPSG